MKDRAVTPKWLDRSLKLIALWLACTWAASTLLAISALIVAIFAGAGKAPLWVAVILLCICVLLMVLPAGGVAIVR